MVRMLVALACYGAFFATFLYLIAFTLDLPQVAVTVNRGAPPTGMGLAVAIDLALIALFGVQHSVMARPAAKAWLTNLVPASLERSLFVLASSAALVVLFAQWRPIPGLCWQVDGAAGQVLLALGLAGWGIVLISTFLLNHFELFGLAQAWRGDIGGKATFRTPLFYRWVRHPIYTGFLLALWAAPEMSASRALLALGLTVYVFIGIAHEERDLIATFGEDYRSYKARVGKLLPGLGRG